MCAESSPSHGCEPIHFSRDARNQQSTHYQDPHLKNASLNISHRCRCVRRASSLPHESEPIHLSRDWHSTSINTYTPEIGIPSPGDVAHQQNTSTNANISDGCRCARRASSPSCSFSCCCGTRPPRGPSPIASSTASWPSLLPLRRATASSPASSRLQPSPSSCRSALP